MWYSLDEIPEEENDHLLLLTKQGFLLIGAFFENKFYYQVIQDNIFIFKQITPQLEIIKYTFVWDTK